MGAAPDKHNLSSRINHDTRYTTSHAQPLHMRNAPHLIVRVVPLPGQRLQVQHDVRLLHRGHKLQAAGGQPGLPHGTPQVGLGDAVGEHAQRHRRRVGCAAIHRFKVLLLLPLLLLSLLLPLLLLLPYS